jgi:hypothetical protein
MSPSMGLKMLNFLVTTGWTKLIPPFNPIINLISFDEAFFESRFKGGDSALRGDKNIKRITAKMILFFIRYV